MRINPKYIQLLGDSIIPLLGFFFWNWSLYFILIFYFLDLLTKEVLLHLKSKKINDFKNQENAAGYNNEITSWGKYGIISIALLSFCLFLIQFSMPSIQNNFNSLKELNAFWTYKDVGGIEQGYFLIPLIVFMGFTQYKMEFLRTGIYARLSIQELWHPHIKSLFIMLGFCALSFGIVQFIVTPEWVFVLGIVFISSIYQLLLLKK